MEFRQTYSAAEAHLDTGLTFRFSAFNRFLSLPGLPLQRFPSRTCCHPAELPLCNPTSVTAFNKLGGL